MSHLEGVGPTGQPAEWTRAWPAADHHQLTAALNRGQADGTIRSDLEPKRPLTHFGLENVTPEET